jgi:hypothetical protein
LVFSVHIWIFLLSGVVDVVPFCTIRRVLPVKEVARTLFTGRIRAQVKSPGDTTWYIGSLEAGEKSVSDSDLSLPVNDDYFVLRLSKFEIVTPPPVVLPNKIVVIPSAPWNVARLSFRVSTEVVVRSGPWSPPPRRTRSIPWGPLPHEYPIHDEDAEGHGHSPIPHQGPARRLPPIPQGPQTPILSSVVEKRETPPPPCRPITTLGRQSPASRSVSSHNHS